MKCDENWINELRWNQIKYEIKWRRRVEKGWIKLKKKEDEPGWKNFERDEIGKKNIVTWKEKRKATKWAEKTLYVIRMDGLKLEKKE